MFSTAALSPIRWSAGDEPWLWRDSYHRLHLPVIEPAAKHGAGGGRADLDARSLQASADSVPRREPENSPHDCRLADDLRCDAWSAVVASPKPDHGNARSRNRGQPFLIRPDIGRLVDVHFNCIIRHRHGPALDVAVGQRQCHVVVDNNHEFTPGSMLDVLCEGGDGRQ